MSARERFNSASDRLDAGGAPPEKGPRGHNHGRLAMIACCIPMIAIAAVIALNGAGIGFFLLAVVCTLMMAAMMGGMGGGGGDEGARR